MGYASSNLPHLYVPCGGDELIYWPSISINQTRDKRLRNWRMRNWGRVSAGEGTRHAHIGVIVTRAVVEELERGIIFTACVEEGLFHRFHLRQNIAI